MGSAQPKFDQQFTGSDQTRPRGLGCNGRLKVEEVDQARFNELCLRQRRDNLENRFVWKEHRAFRHRIDVAGETQSFEPLKKIGTEVLCLSEPVDLLFRKGKFFEKFERRLETGSDKK